MDKSKEVMFKYKIILLNTDWEIIAEVRLRVPPRLDEVIYLKDQDRYYSVVNVIHSPNSKREFILVLDGIKNSFRKKLDD